MSKHKFKNLDKNLREKMINSNLINKRIYKNHPIVVKHQINKKKKKGYKSEIVIVTNSNFYSEAELINNILKDEANSFNIKPFVKIDPNSIKIDKTKMTESEKAFILARKYRFNDPTYTLKMIWHKNKTKKMSIRDIKIVFDIVSKIKATKKV